MEKYTVAAILVNYIATDANTGQTLNLTGMMSYADRGVGGGPIPPAKPVDPGYGVPEHPVDPGYGVPERPPHIWGPTDPRPTPPIYLPPVTPGDPPLVIWGPNDPRPTPPIYLPPAPPDVTPSPPDAVVKPPPADGGWAYVSSWGWGYFPKAGEAGPKG